MLDLRLATLKDAISISRMSAALIEYGLPTAWTPARVVHHIRRKDSVVLIARSEDQILGFAVMEFADVTAHLDLLAVSTLVRRRGVGRRMLEWLHQTAITLGTFAIELEVRAENITAQKFYSAMGYQQCGYRPRYYVGREDAICMAVNLAVDNAAAAEFLLPWNRRIQT
jgi:ribosomal-protein-alanine N-acetyltransferase